MTARRHLVLGISGQDRASSAVYVRLRGYELAGISRDAAMVVFPAHDPQSSGAAAR